MTSSARGSPCAPLAPSGSVYGMPLPAPSTPSLSPSWCCPTPPGSARPTPSLSGPRPVQPRPTPAAIGRDAYPPTTHHTENREGDLSAPMTNLLEIRNLHINIEDREIVKGIDLVVNRGQVH